MQALGWVTIGKCSHCNNDRQFSSMAGIYKRGAKNMDCSVQLPAALKVSISTNIRGNHHIDVVGRQDEVEKGEWPSGHVVEGGILAGAFRRLWICV